LDIALAKRRIGYLLFATVALVPFVFVPIRRFHDFFYAPKACALTIIAMLFLLILLQYRKAISSLIRFDSINRTLLIYFMLLVVSLFFALDRELAVHGSPRREDGFRMMMVYFLLFLAARTGTISRTKFNVGIEISATILSIYGIMQFYGLDPFPRDFIRTGWRSAFSTFGNPNFFGSYLVLVMPIVLDSFVGRRRNISGLTYSILLYALLCTRTRGAWIGATVAIVAYLVINRLSATHRKQDIRRIISILLITVAVVLAFNGLNDNAFMKRYRSIFDDAARVIRNEEAERAGAGRIFLWRRVILLIKERPLTGYGIENLREPFTERFGQEVIAVFGSMLYFDKAHNEYLHIAVTTGIPSLIVYLACITQVLRAGLSKSRAHDAYHPFMSSVLGYLVQAFFNISVVSVAYIFWVFLGILCNYDDLHPGPT
jgi:O-antigen ligase